MSLPDYALDPNAVLKDKNVKWRFNRVPDYAKTRAWYEESKHEARVRMYK